MGINLRYPSFFQPYHRKSFLYISDYLCIGFKKTNRATPEGDPDNHINNQFNKLTIHILTHLTPGGYPLDMGMCPA